MENNLTDMHKQVYGTERVNEMQQPHVHHICMCKSLANICVFYIEIFIIDDFTINLYVCYITAFCWMLCF
jgi:hypothetical protein